MHSKILIHMTQQQKRKLQKLSTDTATSFEEKKICSTRITFFDEPSEAVEFSCKEKFKIEYYLPMMDRLELHLKQIIISWKKFMNASVFYAN